MMGEDTVGLHGGAWRHRRYISGQPWSKSCGKPGGGDGTREMRSRGREGGNQGQGCRDSEMMGWRQETPIWAKTPCGGCRC